MVYSGMHLSSKLKVAIKFCTSSTFTSEVSALEDIHSFMKSNNAEGKCTLLKVLGRGKVKIADETFLESAKSNEEDWDYTVFEQFGQALSNYEELKFDQTLQIGVQLLEQLEWVHKAGYVHYDIKPSNITIGHSDTDQPTQARLIDFGVCTKWERR